MNLQSYVSLKASNLGLSVFCDSYKTDGDTTVVNTTVVATYQATKDGEVLTRRVQRPFMVKRPDLNDCIDIALTLSVLNFVGQSLDQVKVELDTILGADKKEAAPKEAAPKETVEKPVESVDKPIEVVAKEEEPPKVIRKKRASKKKATKKKAVEVKAEEPVSVDEVVSEFDDLGITVEPELLCFDRAEPKHTSVLSKLLIELHGQKWKQKPDVTRKLNSVLDTLSNTKLFSPLGEISSTNLDTIKGLLL